jgi:inner membrane transporter RhtA
MARTLDRVPPEGLFVTSGISMYAGASIAVLLFPVLAPAGVAWWRVLGAGVLLVLVRRSWRRSWTRRDLVAAALFGTALAAMNLSFYLAIDRLPLGNAVAIEFIGPTVVAALGTRTRRSWFALALAVSGVLVLAGIEVGGTLAGVGFALLAGTLWAAYIVLGERVATSGASVDGLGVGMIVGALAISPFGLVPAIDALAMPSVVALALATAILSNVFPYALDQHIFTRVSRSRFAILNALLPATATVVGLVVLRQVPSILDLAGIGLVVAGIALGAEREIDTAGAA